MFIFLKKKLFFEKFDLKKWKINKKSRGVGVKKRGREFFTVDFIICYNNRKE